MQRSDEKRRTFWHWLRPQFSLRVLIALVTLFAIGFPIWYRWPYQTTEHLDGGKTTRTTTWQRQWGGSRLQHGQQRLTRQGFTQSSNYRNGELHGPYATKLQATLAKGTAVTPPSTVTGQYVHGQKDGVWEYRFGRGNGRLNWRSGVLHGDSEFMGNNTGTLSARFDSGRLVELNGKPVEDDFIDRFRNKQLDERVAYELTKETNMDVVEMPLGDCLLYLSEMHGKPIVIDDKAAAKRDEPLTGTFQGMDLRSLLVLITAPRGLACDYRYGRLWITTKDDAANWSDPTGVENLIPPKDSDLARAWNEPINVQVVQKPLAEVLHDISLRLAIPIQTASIAPSVEQKRSTVTLNLTGTPFRHALGHLLYQARGRCRLEEGKLVIEPQELPESPTAGQR